MPRFTLQQKKAHDPLRHLAITANAGSGKTRVLVHRFCDLIEVYGVRPERIVAITFTEDAASELLSRIRDELNARLESVGDSDRRGRLLEAQSTLDSLPIETIHSFCASIVREHPLAARTDPSFDVLQPVDRQLLERDAIDSGIESVFSSGDRFNSAYLDLTRRAGRHTLERLAHLMLANRESIELHRSALVESSRSDRVRYWERQVESFLVGPLKSPDVVGAIDRLGSQLVPKKLEQFNALRPRLDQANPWRERAASLREIVCRLMFTQRGTPLVRSFPRDSGIDELHPDVQVVKPLVNRLLQFDVGDDLDEQLNRRYDDTRLLYALFDEVERVYADLKRERNALDYDDMQILAYRIVSDPGLLAHVASRYDHIMVDEFQDTNRLQYEIVRRAAGELAGDARLSIIGDTKQSIYRFRGAQVEVFSTATDELVRANRDLGISRHELEYRREAIADVSDSERVGVLALSASFRLAPGIASVVNSVCGPYLQSVSEGVDRSPVSWDPIVVGRRTELDGSIEIIVPGDSDPHDSADEAELIARRIRTMVDDGEALVHDGTARPVRFDDIAVLATTWKVLDRIETSLRELEIPVAPFNRRGFYARQEVADVANYLRVLSSPQDDIALLGLLRSPFYTISDPELFRVRIGRTHDDDGARLSLWSSLQTAVATDQAGDAIKHAVRTIQRHRRLVDRLSVAELMYVIIDDTDWRGAVAGSFRVEQIYANVERLIEFARSFEVRDAQSLGQFNRRLERLMIRDEESPSQDEPIVDSEVSGVRVMTVHGAKGLEFPVVFLAGTNSRGAGSAPSLPLFDPELGIGWSQTIRGSEETDNVSLLIRERERQREREEEARKLYVAMTRARDVLIFCGSRSKKGGIVEDSWMGKVAELLDEVPDVNGEVRIGSSELGFLSKDGATVETRMWSQAVRVWREIPHVVHDRGLQHTREAAPAPRILLSDVEPTADTPQLTVRSIVLGAACPTRWYLEEKLRLSSTFVASTSEHLSSPATDWWGSRSPAQYLSTVSAPTLATPLSLDRQTVIIVGSPDELVRRTEREVAIVQEWDLAASHLPDEQIRQLCVDELNLLAWQLLNLEEVEEVQGTARTSRDGVSAEKTYRLADANGLTARVEEMVSSVLDLRAGRQVDELPAETPFCPGCPWLADGACTMSRLHYLPDTHTTT